MNSEKYAEASALFDKVHGEGSAQQTISFLRDISPDLADFSINWIFGDIYSDDTLSLKTRELMNIASLVAIGAEPQLKNHIYAAINVGCSYEEVKAAILQMLIIVGFPKVVNAMMVFDAVIKSIDTKE